VYTVFQSLCQKGDSYGYDTFVNTTAGTKTRAGQRNPEELKGLRQITYWINERNHYF
jgi:hypothetical protein